MSWKVLFKPLSDFQFVEFVSDLLSWSAAIVTGVRAKIPMMKFCCNVLLSVIIGPKLVFKEHEIKLDPFPNVFQNCTVDHVSDL